MHMPDTTVGKIMTTDLITINVNAIVSEAAQIFDRSSFHHIPVVENDGSLAGILSLTDIDRMKTGASLFKNPSKEEYDTVFFRSTWVRDVMTKVVVELSPEDSIRKAYHIFKENKFRALPIVHNSRLAGIVTPLDILNYFFEKIKH